MTIKEFLMFIFSSGPIVRQYYRKQSKSEMVSEIALKLTRDDDIKILNQDSKNFAGSFVPNTDNFTANILRKPTIKTTFSMYRFINIYGALKEEKDMVTIDVEYKQSKKFKTHKIAWALLFLFIFIRVTSVGDIQSFLIVFLALDLILIFVLKTYNSILREQIDFTKKHLIYNE